MLRFRSDCCIFTLSDICIRPANIVSSFVSAKHIKKKVIARPIFPAGRRLLTLSGIKRQDEWREVKTGRRDFFFKVPAVLFFPAPCFFPSRGAVCLLGHLICAKVKRSIFPPPSGLAPLADKHGRQRSTVRCLYNINMYDRYVTGTRHVFFTKGIPIYLSQNS